MRFVITRHQSKFVRFPHYYMGAKGMWSPYMRDAEFYDGLQQANEMLRKVKGQFTATLPPGLKVVGVDDEQADQAQAARAALAEQQRTRIEGGGCAD